MSWLMCAWSLVNMWLLSERHYRAGWTSSIASQFGWAWLAYTSQLWGMLAFSGCMLVVGYRGYRKAIHG